MEHTKDCDIIIAQRAAEAAVKIQQLGPNGYALISCSKTKNTHRDLARHMYASPLFRKSVLVAERLKLSFSILSAKFGLLEPDTPIEPYDTTLKGQSKQYKTNWGEKVLDQIRQWIPSDKALIALAGEDYLSPISERLEAEGRSLYLPMKGLSLGQRLSFLNYILRIEKRQDAARSAYGLFEWICARFPQRRRYFRSASGGHTSRSSLPSLLPAASHYH